eukprot:3405369-Prymnesium_polylepis.2
MQKSSQWMTLWAEHALVLAERENELHEKWSATLDVWAAPGFEDDEGVLSLAIDEYFWYPELMRHNMTIVTPALTWFSWELHESMQDLTLDVDFLQRNIKHGHPATWLTARAAVAVAEHLGHSERGEFFARKFKNEAQPSVTEGLKPFVRTNIGWADPPSPPSSPNPPSWPAELEGCSEAPAIKAATILGANTYCKAQHPPCEKFAYRSTQESQTSFVLCHEGGTAKSWDQLRSGGCIAGTRYLCVPPSPPPLPPIPPHPPFPPPLAPP